MNSLKKLLLTSLTIALLPFAANSQSRDVEKRTSVSTQPVRKVYVSESLKAANPYLSFILKRDYEEGAKLALERSCTGEQCPALSFHFSNDTADKVMNSLAKENADVVIGFAFSNNAALAAKTSRNSSALIITPTASYDELFGSKKVVSLGVMASEVVRAICDSVKDITKSVTMAYPSDILYANAHARIVKEQCSDIKIDEISYFSAKKDAKEIAKKITAAGNPVIFPGYVHDAIPILQALNKNQFRKRVYGTSQWAYSVDIIKTSVKNPTFEILAASDFFTADTKPIAKRFRSSYLKKYGKEPNQFATAVYDAVTFTIRALADCTSKQASQCFNDTGIFEGVSGSFKFQDGKYMTEFDLHRWEKESFQPTGRYKRTLNRKDLR